MNDQVVCSSRKHRTKSNMAACTGIHSIRLGPFALFDLVLAALVEAFLLLALQQYLHSSIRASFVLGLYVALVVLAESVHAAMGTKTQLRNWLHGDFSNVCTGLT